MRVAARVVCVGASLVCDVVGVYSGDDVVDYIGFSVFNNDIRQPITLPDGTIPTPS